MSDELSTLLERGIQAARGGRKEQARSLLLQAIEQDDRDEVAWLWLSGVVEEVEDQFVCLENVLVIDPANAAAQRGLEILNARHPDRHPASKPDPGLAEPPEMEMDAPLAEDGEHDEEPPEFWPPAGSMWEDYAAPLVDEEPAPESGDGIATRICIHCGTVNPAWRHLCMVCNKVVGGGMIDPEDKIEAPAEPEIDQVDLVSDPGYQPAGLASLFVAWVAALSFNRRGAYEYEAYSASAGRTIAGVFIGGVAIPAIVIVLGGIMLAMVSTDDTLGMVTSLAAAPTMAILAAVAGALLVVLFYLWAAILYGFAWLMGGKASFTVHAQLVSISFSASNLVSSLLGVLSALMLGSFSVPLDGPSWLPLVLGLAGLLLVVYLLALNGQAVATAQRFSWLGGVGLVVLGGLCFGLVLALLGLFLAPLVDPSGLFPTLA